MLFNKYDDVELLAWSGVPIETHVLHREGDKIMARIRQLQAGAAPRRAGELNDLLDEMDAVQHDIDHSTRGL